MPKTFTSLHHLLPLQSVKLGSLVSRWEQPTQEYIYPEDLVPEKQQVFHQELTNLELEDGKKKTNALKLLLSKALTGNANDTDHESSKFTAGTYKKYILANTDTLFERMLESPSHRAWLDKRMKQNGKAYLVTAIDTVTDAQLNTSRNDVTDLKAQAENLNLIIEPIVSLPGSASIDVSHNSNTSNLMSYRAPGEQICAISFRKITLGNLIARLGGDKIPKIESGSRNKWYIQPRIVGSKDIDESKAMVLEDFVLEHEVNDDYGVVEVGQDVYLYLKQ
ncbi:hypothetical protein ACHAO8_011562 [Botrytis cinerea]